MENGSKHVDEGARFLLVRSGGYRCAIPVDAAKLVTKATETTALPGSAPRFLGLAQIAGEPVAVVDLHALLDPDGQPGGGHEMTVIVRGPAAGATLGLAVDEAMGVVALTAERERSDEDPHWVSGHSRLDARPIAILDPPELFDDSALPEKGAFDAA
jgi:chemotaxis signal transduction protein